MSKEELQNMVSIAINLDYRLQVCTLTLKDGVWTHQEYKCPKCIALHIIGYQQ